MSKPIKIIVDKAGWDTKIYIDGEYVNEKIGEIFGVDIKIRVDDIPKVTIHRYATKLDFESKKHDMEIKNHKPKKVEGTNIILEDTNYSNCKDGRHYIKKGSKGV